MEYTLVTFEELKLPIRYSEKIRGYFANKYPEYNIIHNHTKDKLIYRYPLIQYKIMNGKPLICGLKEGAKLIPKLVLNEDEITLDNKVFDTLQKSIDTKKVNFGVAEKYISYKLLSPWIALNQRNKKIYDQINIGEQESLLKKILIGNIISMSKGLKYDIKEKLNAEINVRKCEVNLKGLPMLAFKGSFKINFDIPDYLGIGKSVSKGFGVVKKIN